MVRREERKGGEGGNVEEGDGDYGVSRLRFSVLRFTSQVPLLSAVRANTDEKRLNSTHSIKSHNSRLSPHVSTPAPGGSDRPEACGSGS
jgi:hypothetical protein